VLGWVIVDPAGQATQRAFLDEAVQRQVDRFAAPQIEKFARDENSARPFARTRKRILESMLGEDLSTPFM
jgi:hypothetical protein